MIYDRKINYLGFGLNKLKQSKERYFILILV